jgi:hypothetical protein
MPSDGPENLPIAVLVMRRSDLSDLPAETRELLTSLGRDPHNDPFYADSRNEWRPFNDGKARTVRQLIEEAEKSPPLKGIHFPVITDQFFSAMHIADEEELIRILDNDCIYIIDCLSLEHPDVQEAATEIDKVSHFAGFLFPICDSQPSRVKERMKGTRSKILPRIGTRYEKLRDEKLRPNVPDAYEFINSLVSFVRIKSHELYKELGAGIPRVGRRTEIDT